MLFKQYNILKKIDKSGEAYEINCKKVYRMSGNVIY